MMTNSNTSQKANNYGSILVFVLSIWFVIYWTLGQIINIYEFAIIGVIYEILWLPMLIMGLVLPLVALFFLSKKRLNFRSLYLYAFLIVVATILILISSK